MTNDSFFTRIEAALDGDEAELRGDLRTVREALDELLKSGSPKQKAAARRARLAVDRTRGLFDELFVLREKMSGSAATPKE